MLSVIIPAFNEEKTIPAAAETISSILKEADIPAELLFVDDGSRDTTWQTISAISKTNPMVKGVHFSRNFGKEAAVFAGLTEASGDCAVVIDCDLQHPPVKIVEMYRLWEQGYEIVEGVKADRGNESKMHAFAAKSFYSLISAAVGIDMSRASDFKLLDRKAVNVLINMPEKNAFFRALSSWIGFKTATVEYAVQERFAGESKWSTKALIRYAISNITEFSSFPMMIVLGFGILFVILALVTGIQAIAAEGDWLSVKMLICLSSGILMIAVGIAGYYIAKIYEEVKDRPRFIISERIGIEK